MGSIDLLARENEFKKLNKQLEKKTESLMKEIEEVMQKPDIFSTKPNFKLNLQSTHAKHCCDTPKSSPSPETCAQRTRNLCTPPRYSKTKTPVVKTKAGSSDQVFQNTDMSNVEQSDVTNLHSSETCAQRVTCDCCTKDRVNDNMEFLYAFVSVNVKDNILPHSFLKGKITVENICKFLLAKIKLMQEQIDKLQTTINCKSKQCDGHLTRVAELESERLSLLNKANNMRSETADMKAKYLAMEGRLNEKDRLYKEQRSATDRLTTEVKHLRSRNTSLEARCASQEEGIASLKQQLETAKLSEKEYRTSSRSLASSQQSTICELQQKVQVLSKQLQQLRALAGNLRRQRELLAAEAARDLLGRELYQLLGRGG